MEILDQYMPLKNGEKVSACLEGNAYTLSSNPFYRFIAGIGRVIAIIIGIPRKQYIFVTNTRVITISTSKMFWVIDRVVTARSYSSQSILRVGYVRRKDFLLFTSHYLEFIDNGEVTHIKSKEGKNKVYEIINEQISLVKKVATDMLAIGHSA